MIDNVEDVDWEGQEKTLMEGYVIRMTKGKSEIL